MRCYRPSGRCSFGGMVTALLGGGLAAVALGTVLGVVGRWFYLIILFPLLAGWIAGSFGSRLLQGGKCRNLALAVAFGAVLGAIVFVAHHHCSYCQLVLAARSEIAEGLGEPARRSIGFWQTRHVVDQVLRGDTGYGGVLGFMMARAQDGVTISPVASGAGTNLGFVGSWILWAIEGGLMMVLAAAMARAQANRPFCERCGQWYASAKALVPSFDLSALGDVVGRLMRREHREVGAALAPSSQEHEFGKLMMARCPACEDSDVHLQVIAVGRDSKNQTKEASVAEGMVSASDFAALNEGLHPRIPTE
jgi:hypothetical protein